MKTTRYCLLFVGTPFLKWIFIICRITLDSFLLRMTTKEGSALGNPGTRLPLIGCSKKKEEANKQKTISVFLSSPFKFARERVNVRHLWHVSEFSHGNQCCSKDTRPILEITFARLFRQNKWILQFYNNTLATYRKLSKKESWVWKIK